MASYGWSYQTGEALREVIYLQNVSSLCSTTCSLIEVLWTTLTYATARPACPTQPAPYSNTRGVLRCHAGAKWRLRGRTYRGPSSSHSRTPGWRRPTPHCWRAFEQGSRCLYLSINYLVWLYGIPSDVDHTYRILCVARKFCDLTGDFNYVGVRCRLRSVPSASGGLADKSCRA